MLLLGSIGAILITVLVEALVGHFLKSAALVIVAGVGTWLVLFTILDLLYGIRAAIREIGIKK